MNSRPLTPLMRQYFSIKDAYPDTILLFQVGDFYELFFEDALTAASVLGIALTKRGTHQGEPIPLCGVPLHVRDHYIAKLVKAGFKVALCDQLEIPQPGKVVERGVTQVLTPGTLTDSRLLDEKSASYLGAFFPGTSSWTLLCAELLTGQLCVTLIPDCAESSLDAELNRFMPDEIILPQRLVSQWAPFFQRQGFVVSPENTQSSQAAQEWFIRQFGDHSQLLTESFLGAVELLYCYVLRTNEQALSHLKQLSVVGPEEYVVLDAATQRNLELIKNCHDGSSKNTLFSVLDKAVTSMGSRMLKKWILRPLRTQSRCEERLDAVENVVVDHTFKTELRAELSSIGDLERIVGRIALRRTQIHDYKALLLALLVLPSLKKLLQSRSSSLLKTLGGSLHDFTELHELLVASLPDEGTDWLIKYGFDTELDRLRDLIKNGAQCIAVLEAHEQKKTGITSLKVNYNSVHGYAFEVTKPHISRVPAYYIRMQTLSNKERYTTAELKELEHDLQRARSESTLREKELYESIKVRVEQFVPDLKKAAYALAYADSIAALGELAYRNGYVRPTFNQNREFHIHEGRHPVVAQRLQKSFIPNSLNLTDDASLLLITGPNMGGKSTFLRQGALITLMAQIGSFVPAAKADLPLVDRIFTRIGASDNVAEGKSTFLVEMEETALICSYATEKSLVILDEVGRGTSTFDGLAIAQAVVEYIYETLQARCLFATHYHELTVLCDSKSAIKPFYAASMKKADSIVLLHKIIPGVSDGSFGLEVAALAQVPQEIIQRARTILTTLKEHELSLSSSEFQNRASHTPHYHDVYQEKQRERADFIAAQIADIDCNAITPKQALELLWSLKEDHL